jgi:hypothetical protein
MAIAPKSMKSRAKNRDTLGAVTDFLEGTERVVVAHRENRVRALKRALPV